MKTGVAIQKARPTIMDDSDYTGRFSASNALTDNERDVLNDTHANYWSSIPYPNPAPYFVIDLGTEARIHTVYISNSHNGHVNSRYFKSSSPSPFREEKDVL